MTNAQSGILDSLQSVADNNGFISYRDFIQVSLYDPELGYYTRDKNRTGRNSSSDFYTASNLGKVFRNLIVSAAENLCENKASEYSFIEIGAEPGKALLNDCDNPFKEVRTIRLGEAIEIPRKSIVFSNELLDAQPFHRLIFKNGRWREMGLSIKEGKLLESINDELSPEAKAASPLLPAEHIEGYILDLPLDSEKLMMKIVEQIQDGVLIFLDYGKSWSELIHDHPQGTGRAYYKHKLSGDLLENPGDQDITCHICWDKIESILESYNFTNISLKSQESFFVTFAQKEFERIMTAHSDGGLNPDIQTLKELIHPAHMGQKFQAICATRSS